MNMGSKSERLASALHLPIRYCKMRHDTTDVMCRMQDLSVPSTVHANLVKEVISPSPSYVPRPKMSLHRHKLKFSF